ncbi:head maturation protease, ClpP-related [Listeria monocytogenes]|uniref:ATP-dependent Clp protease proteolytic subunit n=1 Tax=Listeria monocytogenes TaxID=1639 RepID=A0A6C8N007_LISMN|nr:head maturation protease, ClpP-related [Listeria monocytogenes]KAA9534128.1 peptidase [Listeria monocytogenes]KAA9541447.1 peptidase [Listeria monocytogenes]
MKRIDVKGVIVSNDDKWIYDYFERESTAPKDFDTALTGSVEPIEVVINSGGGDVYSGSEIYSILKEYAGDVTIKIVGRAASAASVIAMAGKTVKIAPTAQIMIHNAATEAYGDHRDMQNASGFLENYNKSICSAYVLKTGKTENELLEMMNAETWLNAKQAKEQGFVDEIMFEEEAPKLVASATASMLPEDVINTVRNSQLVEQKKQQEVLTKEDVQNMIKEALEPQTIENEEPPEEKQSPFKRFLF